MTRLYSVTSAQISSLEKNWREGWSSTSEIEGQITHGTCRKCTTHIIAKITQDHLHTDHSKWSDGRGYCVTYIRL